MIRRRRLQRTRSDAVLRRIDAVVAAGAALEALRFLEVFGQQFPTDAYNGQPLCYAGLAAQKNHNALYLMGVYGDPRQEAFLQKEFRKRRKKLDMGKSSLRFKRVEDLPLDVIGEVIRRTPPKQLMAMHDAAVGRN